MESRPVYKVKVCSLVCAEQAAVLPRSPVVPAKETSQHEMRLNIVVVMSWGRRKGKECLVKEKRGKVAAC
jgi:hypothetical protein